jgi:hypothetical protein
LRIANELVASDWKKWQEAGLDTHGRYTPGPLQGQKVFIRPNPHERGRGHIVVYNWEGADEVQVDLARVVTKGQKYRIVAPQDFYGESLAEGTYAGGEVGLPLKPINAPKPIGLPDTELPAVGHEFAVFVVLPMK